MDQIKEAALDLERKNVNTEAAQLWEQYLQLAPLTAVEAGNIRYRIGRDWQNAGEPERAFAQYVLAEILLGQSNPDLSDEIGQRRIECLRQMGQLADLEREIAERARPANAPEGDLEGVQVAAEIGNQHITVSDFDRMLTNQIDLAVRSRPGLSAEEERINRERYHQQFADPQRRAEELQRLVATRVLAEEARKEQIHQGADFRERVTELIDGILAQSLLMQEVSRRAMVTPQDVERFFAAHEDRYAEPAGTFIAHILCRDRQHARDIIDRIQQGASFEDIAKAESLDDRTREKYGILAEPVPAEGNFVPLFGANQQLHDTIRDTDAGAVLPQPYESSRGWCVIKVMSHRQRMVKPLDDIREQVRRDTLAARREEVTRQYMESLFDRYEVKLYPQVFGAASDAAEQETNATP